MMAPVDHLTPLGWRTSSFTEKDGSNGGTCVQAAALPDGRVAIRNSNATDPGVIIFTRAEMDAWIKGVKAGEFDDLT